MRGMNSGLINFEQAQKMFYQEWKKYLEELGFTLERYTWEYFKDHEDEILAMCDIQASKEKNRRMSLSRARMT